MKYKILNQTDSRVELFVLYEDNTFIILNLAQDTLENVLKNAYILSKNAANRLPCTEETPVDLETYEKPQSVATKITNVNFYNFTADIYDQYGDLMQVDIEFTIDSEHARIESGTIIEDAVTQDASYFIVARYENLEERQERFLYAPREVEPIEDTNKETLQRIADLEELLQKVDNDLNALVGGSDE